MLFGVVACELLGLSMLRTTWRQLKLLSVGHMKLMGVTGASDIGVR